MRILSSWATSPLHPLRPGPLGSFLFVGNRYAPPFLSASSDGSLVLHNDSAQHGRGGCHPLKCSPSPCGGALPPRPELTDFMASPARPTRTTSPVCLLESPTNKFAAHMTDAICPVHSQVLKKATAAHKKELRLSAPSWCVYFTPLVSYWMSFQKCKEPGRSTAVCRILTDPNTNASA